MRNKELTKQIIKVFSGRYEYYKNKGSIDKFDAVGLCTMIFHEDNQVELTTFLANEARIFLKVRYLQTNKYWFKDTKHRIEFLKYIENKYLNNKEHEKNLNFLHRIIDKFKSVFTGTVGK